MKKIEDVFIRFDIIHERDRQTDGHRMTAQAALHSIARQKLLSEILCGNWQDWTMHFRVVYQTQIQLS